MATNNPKLEPSDDLERKKEKEDPFTPAGYAHKFEQCEDSRAVLEQIKILFGKYDFESCKNVLIHQGDYDTVKYLFKLYEGDLRLKTTTDCLNALQFFLLLENVYRNAILRPYVPAYRTINTDCGRYRSFVLPLKERVPFVKLKFIDQKPNRLVYTGTDLSETIVCANTCGLLAHTLNKFHEEFIKKQNQDKSSQV